MKCRIKSSSGGIQIKKSRQFGGTFTNVTNMLFAYNFEFELGTMTIAEVDIGFIST